MAESDSIPARRGFYFDKRKGRFRVHICCSGGGRRVERTKLLPLHTTEGEAYEYAQAMRASLMRELIGLEPAVFWPASVERARLARNSWLHDILKRAKARSARKRRVFELTADDLVAILLRSEGRCEVTGLAFSEKTNPGSKMRPLAPSLDRISAADGYVSGNCRVVCAAVNVAMFNWGEDTFKSIAIGYLVNQVIAPHAPILQLGSGYRLGHDEIGSFGGLRP